MKNIGKKSREWLKAIGIETLDEIDTLGAVEVYVRLKQAFPREISLNMLWGLQGAILDIPYNQLPPEMRESLLAEVQTRLAEDE